MSELIRLKSGDNRTLRFSITTVDGGPQNLSGAVFEMHVSTALYRPAVFTKTTLDGGVVIVGDPEEGNVDVFLEPADTEALAGVYVYEFEITDGAGHVLTVQHPSTKLFYAPLYIEHDLIAA